MSACPPRPPPACAASASSPFLHACPSWPAPRQKTQGSAVPGVQPAGSLGQGMSTAQPSPGPAQAQHRPAQAPAQHSKGTFTEPTAAQHSTAQAHRAQAHRAAPHVHPSDGRRHTAAAAALPACLGWWCLDALSVRPESTPEWIVPWHQIVQYWHTVIGAGIAPGLGHRGTRLNGALPDPLGLPPSRPVSRQSDRRARRQATTHAQTDRHTADTDVRHPAWGAACQVSTSVCSAS
jgi:hypothetical protein